MEISLAKGTSQPTNARGREIEEALPDRPGSGGTKHRTVGTSFILLQTSALLYVQWRTTIIEVEDDENEEKKEKKDSDYSQLRLHCPEFLPWPHRPPTRSDLVLFTSEGFWPDQTPIGNHALVT